MNIKFQYLIFGLIRQNRGCKSFRRRLKRFQNHVLLFRFPITLVGGIKNEPIAYRLDDGRKVFLAGGDILEDNPVLETGGFVQKAVQAQGLKHPLTHVSGANHIDVGDMMCVVTAVALDVDSKNVCNRLDMVEQGAGSEFLVIAVHGTFHP